MEQSPTNQLSSWILSTARLLICGVAGFLGATLIVSLLVLGSSLGYGG